MRSFKQYVKETPDKTKSEEVAANSVAGGGVDLNPTGKVKKMDKRSRLHPESLYRRNKG